MSGPTNPEEQLLAQNKALRQSNERLLEACKKLHAFASTSLTDRESGKAIWSAAIIEITGPAIAAAEQEQAGQQVEHRFDEDGVCEACGWSRMGWHPDYCTPVKISTKPAQPRPEQAQEWTWSMVRNYCDQGGFVAIMHTHNAELATLRRERDSLNQLYTLANDHVTDLRRELEQAKEVTETWYNRYTKVRLALGITDYLAHDETLQTATDLRTRLAEAERTIITQGKQCAVSVTGFPDDEGEINSVESAMKAIQAELKLGRESHNKLAEAEKDTARLNAVEQLIDVSCYDRVFLLRNKHCGWSITCNDYKLDEVKHFMGTDIRQAIDSARAQDKEGE